ncbi:MAG: PAS domain-containing sensor histidine kinase [Candidatus Hodarchaeales archaeon]
MSFDNLEKLSKSELIALVQNLHMSDVRFQSLVEYTSDALFCYEYTPPISIDLPIKSQIEMFYGGILVECNDIAAQSYGYSQASEVLGKSLTELFKATPGSLDDFFRSFIEREYRTINAEAYETLEDGSKRYFLNNGHAVIINRHIERVWGTYREITEIKKAEEALMQSEERLELALEGGDFGIWDHNVETGIVIRNEQTAKIHGFSLEEMEETSRWWESRIHPEDKLGVREKLDQCIRGVTPFFEAEYRLLHRSGDWKWVLSRGKVVEYDENNKAIRIAGVLRDISEQKQAELLKKELEKRRENFIWMTSHELRTPLTVISGYFEMVEREVSTMDLERRAKIFSIISRNLTRFEDLIDRVSSIIQIEQELFEIEFAEFDLCEFLNNVLDSYQQTLGDQIVYNGCQKDALLIINGDKDRLLQVLENIIGNAIKQTHPRFRAIFVNLEVFSSEIQIIISDNGAGIAPENLEKIFEQFTSINTEYSVTGTGLGLFISRRILEAHNGSIVALSEGTGKGSSFIITLPRI